MTIKTHLTESDYRAFQRHMMFRYRKLHWVLAVPFFIMTLSSLFGGKPGETTVQKVSVLIGSLFTMAVIMSALFGVFWLIKKISRTNFTHQLGAHTFEVSLGSVIEENDATRLETKTAGIKRVDESADHFFIITKPGFGHIIPKRDVANHDPILSLKAAVEAMAGK
ncbi:MAG: YcxB family protein [Nibricoccus sp.]